MSLPVCASDGKDYHSDWRYWYNQYVEWVKQWCQNKPDTPEEPEATLDTPTITEAKYTHQRPYYGSHPNLRIRWNEVENAESYEVEVTKADGTVNTYTATGTSFYSEKVECPRVYVESTSTWASATARVRAVSGETTSEWSESVKISCDTLHFK